MPTQLIPNTISSDKICIRWWKNAWNLKAPTRGTIFLFHGIGEHSARYEEFAQYCTEWGFDVFSFDYPGFGLTARKGNFIRFADFDEMKTLAKEALHYWMVEGPHASPELRAKPIFFLGHSLGALLSLYWLATENPGEDSPFYPQRALATSPPIALSLKVPFWKELIAHFLKTSWPDIKMGNEISPSELSHDCVKTFEYVQDPWRMSKASPRLYLSMRKTMGYLRSSFLNVQVPLMLMSGAGDDIIDHAELKRYYDNLNTHKKWIEFKDMKHEVLNEIGREKVYEEVIKWFLH